MGTSTGAGDIAWSDVTGVGNQLTVNFPQTTATTAHLRLWFKMADSPWQSVDQTYQLDIPPAVVITSHTDGQTITSSTETFTWAGGAHEYFFAMGTRSGGGEIAWSDATGVGNTFTVNFPLSATTVYLRLWYKPAGGPWQSIEHVYSL